MVSQRGPGAWQLRLSHGQRCWYIQDHASLGRSSRSLPLDRPSPSAGQGWPLQLGRLDSQRMFRSHGSGAEYSTAPSTQTTGASGFRLDAIKHIDRKFLIDFVSLMFIIARHFFLKSPIRSGQLKRMPANHGYSVFVRRFFSLSGDPKHSSTMSI